MRRTFLSLLYFSLPALAADCNGVIGNWKWFNGGTVTFTQQKTVLMNGKEEGKWTCSDPNRSTLVLRWKGGFIDTLSVNSNRLTGKNQQGVPIAADRKAPGR